jgi:hypothetical protein
MYYDLRKAFGYLDFNFASWIFSLFSINIAVPILFLSNRNLTLPIFYNLIGLHFSFSFSYCVVVEKYNVFGCREWNCVYICMNRRWLLE